MLEKSTTQIKPLERRRKSFSMFTSILVYSAHVLPTIVYCSTPVLKISDIMTQKFEKLQEKAQKIIYCQAN